MALPSHAFAPNTQGDKLPCLALAARWVMLVSKAPEKGDSKRAKPGPPPQAKLFWWPWELPLLVVRTATITRGAPVCVCRAPCVTAQERAHLNSRRPSEGGSASVLSCFIIEEDEAKNVWGEGTHEKQAPTR